MLYRSATHSSQGRPGVVLLVVMGLLSLFAVVALSFVFYADAEAISAKHAADALQRDRPDIDPEVLAQYFLSQMIYGTTNEHSALQGKDLASGIYGYNRRGLNNVAYNGAGRDSFAPTNVNHPTLGVPYFTMINNQVYDDLNPISGPTSTWRQIVRRPEYYGSAVKIQAIALQFPNIRVTTTIPHGLAVGDQVFVEDVVNPRYNGGPFTINTIVNPSAFTYPATLPVAPPVLAASNGGVVGKAFRYIGGSNVPWTIQDSNNLFLAQVDADGRVLMPSFYRPWLETLAQAAPAAARKHMRMRPDGDWNPGFMGLLPDSDGGGDVKNMDSGPGVPNPSGGFFNNDSIWIDMGYPVITAPNGRRYKALVAPLIMDLSNKLHLWVHGNQRGLSTAPFNTQHVSNMGLGPPDVNLTKLLGTPIRPTNATVPAQSGASHNAAGTIVTIQTSEPHGILAGETVIIDNVADVRYNGVFQVLAGPTAKSFRYNLAATPALPPSGAGATPVAATVLRRNEIAALHNLRYGGLNPAVRQVNIATASQVGNVVTIVTAAPHGFGVGQRVNIAGAAINVSYRGPFLITKVGPGLNTFEYIHQLTGLPISGGGTAALVPNVAPGTFASLIDADAIAPTVTVPPTTNTGLSSRPFFFPMEVQTTTATAVNFPTPPTTPTQVTITVPQLPIVGPGPTGTGTFTGLPWYFFDAVKVGSMLDVGGELVIVTAVNAANKTFTAGFLLNHPIGAPVKLHYYSGFPMFPSIGWDNANAAELASALPNPLVFNPDNPNGTNKRLLPMSVQEALLRHRGTSSPALTSDIFRLMPTTFANPRSRMLVTGSSSHLDRVTSSPFHNFNSVNNEPHYGFSPLRNYPVLGLRAIFMLTVEGTTGQYTLTLSGHAPTVQIPANAPANVIETALQNRMLPNETAKVYAQPPPAAPPNTRAFLIVFRGSNIDVNQTLIPNLFPAPPPMMGTPPPFNVVATPELVQGNISFAKPNFGVPNSIVTTNSEFDVDGRSKLGQFLRVDLTRKLADYPTPDGTGYIPTGTVAFTQAQQDRQQMARDIYQALVRITGAKDPNTGAPPNVNQANYKAAAYLAQLAVNMVDYIDNDDYMTPFNWHSDSGLPGPPATPANLGNSTPTDRWVFGTELPRLVLNESYAQQEPPPPVGGGMINVWAELHNPYRASALGTFPTDQGSALLTNPNNPANPPPYVIEIHRFNPALTTRLLNAIAANPINNTGSATPLVPLSTQSTWGPNVNSNRVLPTDGRFTSLTIKPITAAAQNGAGVARITSTAHGLPLGTAVLGRPVRIAGVSEPTYNGIFLITNVVNADTVDVTNPAITAGTPAGAGGTLTYGGNTSFYVIGPTGAPYTIAGRNPDVLATHLSSGMTIPSSFAIAAPTPAPAGVTVLGPLVTVVTTTNHNFANNDQVSIAGVTNAMYNGGPFTITVVSANTFTFPNPAAWPDGSSGNGTVTRLGPAIPGVTLLLRRLANPRLPFNGTPGVTYNPYITVDYFDNIPVNPAPNAAAGSPGRSQPYGALAPNPTSSNSFFSHNLLNGVHHWLVHLDRPPVNPIEMLHVSHYKPHQLTHRFFVGNQPYGHVAPWNAFNTNSTAQADPNTLLHRFLDQSSTRYMGGQYTGGRFHGNINLNTLTDLEVWRALCDAHDTSTAQYPKPWFTQNDVDLIYSRLQLSRGVLSTAAPTTEPAPFKSFSAAKGITTTTATGVQFDEVSFGDSWFRPDPLGVSRQLFEPMTATNTPNAHPYMRAALLQKVYNNITTTSNVFAIWWTVGFFEVLDKSTFANVIWSAGQTYAFGDIVTAANGQTYRSKIASNIANPPPTSPLQWEFYPMDVTPERLGAEVGRAQNRHIRHRFFAIVDRAGLELNRKLATTDVNAGVNQTVTLRDPIPGQQPWVIKPGMLLEAISSTNMENSETVRVNAVGFIAGNTTPGMASISADFLHRHTAANTVYVVRGHLGPKDVRDQVATTMALPFPPPALQPGTNTVRVAALGPIREGMFLEIGNDTTGYEVVLVKLPIDPRQNTFTADLTMRHTFNPAVPVHIRTWQPPFNPRKDRNVVLHLNVIQ